MVKVTLMGRDFDVAPYRLGAMIAAAPFMDAQKAREDAITAREAAIVAAGGVIEKAGQTRTVVELFAGIADTVAILHVGISKIDPTVTLDALIDSVENTSESYSALLVDMWGLLGKSGMTRKGEAPALPITAEAVGASDIDSAKLSSNSSPQA